MHETDLSDLATYVVNQGLEKIHEGRSDAEFEAATSKNPLTMRITATHQVEAVDGNGDVYFSRPYTPSMVEHARMENKTIEEQRIAARKVNEKLIKNKARLAFMSPAGKTIGEIGVKE